MCGLAIHILLCCILRWHCWRLSVFLLSVLYKHTTMLKVPYLVGTVELLCSDHKEMVNQCWSKKSGRQKKKKRAVVGNIMLLVQLGRQRDDLGLVAGKGRQTCCHYWGTARGCYPFPLPSPTALRLCSCRETRSTGNCSARTATTQWTINYAHTPPILHL